jgi:hypothetical protein
MPRLRRRRLKWRASDPKKILFPARKLTARKAAHFFAPSNGSRSVFSNSLWGDRKMVHAPPFRNVRRKAHVGPLRGVRQVPIIPFRRGRGEIHGERLRLPNRSPSALSHGGFPQILSDASGVAQGYRSRVARERQKAYRTLVLASMTITVVFGAAAATLNLLG